MCGYSSLACLFTIFITFSSSTAHPDLFSGLTKMLGDQKGDGLEGLKLLNLGGDYPYKEIRLPAHIRPWHYTISIQPDLTSLHVVGSVVINFVVDEPTTFIVFHGKNMNITDKWVGKGVQESKPKESEHKKISNFFESSTLQQKYVELGEELHPKKNYTLGINYETKISSTEMKGFYRSRYTTANGDKHVLATTHFEPTEARTAFPCFDEPSLKATFKMFITHDKKHISLFNMPIKKSKEDPDNKDLIRDEFETTPVRMSTYLVAFIICDFEVIRNKTQKNIDVAIYTPIGLLEQASFALESAVILMDYFDEYFGVPYPLPKQDLVAIPDFAAGAMENWGLITYRDTSLLYDKAVGSSSAQQRVCAVVSHELVHQWFGNLVTMEWWNGLWLKEGFAGYLQYIGLEHQMKGEWRMMEQFILDETQTALHLDALDNSHPISVEVKDPADIAGLFDAISYAKGASVIRMLQVVMGEDKFREGLKQYLNHHKFKNSKQDDLWTALTKSSDDSMDVKTIMDTWTLQMGFPLIRIQIEDTKVKVTQEKFSMNSNETKGEKKESPTWFVPLTYITDLEPKEMKIVWVNKTLTHEFTLPKKVTWIKFNRNQTGFYRVMYEKEMWNAIVAELTSNIDSFSPSDRASLMDDAFTLAKAGMYSAELPLELSKYLLKETDYVPWATGIDNLKGWSKQLYEKHVYRDLNEYISKLAEPIYKHVGWTDTGSHTTRIMRGDILNLAVYCNNKEALLEASKLFNAWMKDGVKVPANLKHVVYPAGVKHGGVDAWNHCWNEYNKTQVTSEKVLLLKAMATSTDPWLLQQQLNFCLNPDKIKTQEVPTVVGVIAANPTGRYLAWRYVRSNWDKLNGLVGEGSFAMGKLVKYVISHFSTEFDLKEVQTFFNGRDMGAGKMALEQSMETIQHNIDWLKKNEKTIEDWLTEEKKEKKKE